jgi:hypothetical protein
MQILKILRWFILSALFLGQTIIVLGQASLTTSYSFWGPMPEGWTIFNGGGAYQQGSDDTPACRLDATGHYVEIFFDEEPGELIYFLKGMTGSGSTWFGTFSILESVNGQTWATRRLINSMNHQAYTEYRDTLSFSSRYVRFYFTNKQFGSNVALDDITLTPRLPGNNAFIHVYFDNQKIYPNTQIVTGNASTATFVIENLGLQENLVPDQIALSGEHAAQFSLSGVPQELAPGSSDSFDLLFEPNGTGSRFATLNIQSNAENVPEFIIHIYAIAGDYATEPAAQPTNLIFPEIKSYAYSAQFEHPVPQAEQYLVLRSKTQTMTGVPADGVTYFVGDTLGNARVVHIGGETTFSPSGVVAGTAFYHQVYAFNGPPGYENYLQGNPLSASITTPPGMIGDFYQGVNAGSPDFIETLQSRIRPHTPFAYGDYINVMISGFEALDTLGGNKVVYCVLSGYAHVYDGPFGWANSPIGGTLSREHTFPFSWYPHNFESEPEYSDFFNLFPAHLEGANIPRSNHPLGEVVNITSQFHEGKLGTNAHGNIVYEPRDSHKGDAARAKFYMLLRYHNTSGNQWFLPPQQDQEILKTWHFQDPPGAWEMARNDFINSQQGNRNPFIDSIHFVSMIDFQTLEWLSVRQIYSENLNITVSPVPADDYVILRIHARSRDTLMITLINLAGQPLKTKKQELDHESTELKIDISGFEAGVYLLKLVCGDQVHTMKVIKI